MPVWSESGFGGGSGFHGPLSRKNYNKQQRLIVLTLLFVLSPWRPRYGHDRAFWVKARAVRNTEKPQQQICSAAPVVPDGEKNCDSFQGKSPTRRVASSRAEFEKQPSKNKRLLTRVSDFSVLHQDETVNPHRSNIKLLVK